MSSLTEALGLDASDYSLVATDTKSFLSSGRFHNFNVGQPVRYIANLGEIEVEASTAFRSGNLHRLTLVKRSPAEGREYYMINGTMRQVRMDNTIVVDGKEYSLAELFCSLVNDGIEDPEKKVTLDRFCEIVGRYGWDIDNRNNGMGLNFMHFGVNLAKVEKIFEWFEECGAVDVTDTIAEPGGIEKVLAFDRNEQGVPISHFRTGTMDRTKTQNGQGFVSFVDAAWGNFDRFVKFRAQARAMNLALEESLASDKPPSKAYAKEAREEITRIANLATEWMGTWGGVTRRYNTASSGEAVVADKFDTAQVPIGTLTAADGKELDFWSNSNDAETVVANAPQVNPEGIEPF